MACIPTQTARIMLAHRGETKAVHSLDLKQLNGFN